MSDRTRFSLDITKGMSDRLDRIMDKTEAASRSEVIRRALIVYEHVLDDDVEVVLRPGDGTETTLKVL